MPGIIALVLAGSALKKYRAQPELYSDYGNVNTGRILAIIGIILNLIFLGYVIFIFVTIGYDGLMEMQDEWSRQYEW